MMDLQDENRILVKEGLQRLHHTTNLGLQELIRVNNLEPENISPYHIGFILGPCLNASGRLDTAKRALQLLLADSREEAAVLAGMRDPRCALCDLPGGSGSMGAGRDPRQRADLYVKRQRYE